MNELVKIYETASNPGSFGGVDALYREAKRNKLKVTKKQVTEWQSNKLSYTLHKPVRKIFQRNKTRVFYVDELWQLDLCDTNALKQYNDGATFILTIIDVFSKMGFARSLIDKKGPTVLTNRVHKQSLQSGTQETRHSFLRHLQRKQSRSGRTLQQNAKVAHVAIFHAQQHVQVRRRFAATD